jgi:DNA polymerase III delta prime subunit
MINKRNYEPKSIDDVIVDDPDTHQRLADHANGIRTEHVLMHGPPGTAKSTTAKVIAETRAKASGNQLDPFIEPYQGVNLNEKELQKIERDWSLQRCGGVKMPVIVINEIDKMSPQMREKLKAFMDEQGDNGQIIGTTNNPHVLSEAMRNRFDEIPMPSVSDETLKRRAAQIISEAGIEMDDDQLDDLVKTANGNWRDLTAGVKDMVIAHKRAA